MCRYAWKGPYKIHYVCFSCRKGFKQPASVVHKCPECGGPMADMGRDLKTPRQSDVKAWKALQRMYRVGHAFHTCGCDGPGWIPQTPHEYREYLAKQKGHYQEQLDRIPNADGLSAAGKRQAIEHWLSRIEAIEREQLSLK